jgi:hypothetical protein
VTSSHPTGRASSPQARFAGSSPTTASRCSSRLTVYLVALLVIPLGYGYLNDRGSTAPRSSR